MMEAILILTFLGLLNMLSKKSAVGVLMGFFLVILSVALFFVLRGSQGDTLGAEGSVVGFSVLLFGAIQVVVGLALSLRRYYQTQKTALDELDALRN